MCTALWGFEVLNTVKNNERKHRITEHSLAWSPEVENCLFCFSFRLPADYTANLLCPVLSEKL